MLQSFHSIKYSKILFIFPTILIIPSLIMGYILFSNVNAYKQEVFALQSELKDIKAEKLRLEEDMTEFQKEMEKAKQDSKEKAEKYNELKDKLNRYEALLKDLELKQRLYSARINSSGNIVTNGYDKAKQKIAYLTFDDGPSVNTRKILDILKKYEIKATFFVIGNERKKDMYEQILSEGHMIGNHTYSHDYKTIYSSSDLFLKDVEKLDALLSQYEKYTPGIYRFPGGSKNASSKKYGGSEVMTGIIDAMSEKGYTYFDWNVTSADADMSGQEADKDVLVDNVLTGAVGRRRAIILMHDSGAKNTTVDALPEIIEGLSALGYKFGVLSGYLTE